MRKKQSQTARSLGSVVDGRRREAWFRATITAALVLLGRGSFRPVFPTPAPVPVPVPSTRSPSLRPASFAASSTWVLVLATREGRVSEATSYLAHPARIPRIISHHAVRRECGWGVGEASLFFFLSHSLVCCLGGTSGLPPLRCNLFEGDAN